MIFTEQMRYELINRHGQEAFDALQNRNQGWLYIIQVALSKAVERGDIEPIDGHYALLAIDEQEDETPPDYWGDEGWRLPDDTRFQER